MRELAEDIIMELREAVKAKRGFQQAYNEWYDSRDTKSLFRMSSDDRRKEHNKEAALRFNLGQAQMRIIELAEKMLECDAQNNE